MIVAFALQQRGIPIPISATAADDNRPVGAAATALAIGTATVFWFRQVQQNQVPQYPTSILSRYLDCISAVSHSVPAPEEWELSLPRKGWRFSYPSPVGSSCIDPYLFFRHFPRSRRLQVISFTTLRQSAVRIRPSS